MSRRSLAILSPRRGTRLHGLHERRVIAAEDSHIRMDGVCRVLVEMARQENAHFHCSPFAIPIPPFFCLKAPIITKAGLRRGRDSDIDSTLSHETFPASIHHGTLDWVSSSHGSPASYSTTGSCKVFSDYSKWRTAKRIHVAVHTTDSRKSASYHYWQADISILYSAVDIRMDKLGTAWTIILLSFRYTWLIGEIIPSQMFDGSTSYRMYVLCRMNEPPGSTRKPCQLLHIIVVSESY